MRNIRRPLRRHPEVVEQRDSEERMTTVTQAMLGPAGPVRGAEPGGAASAAARRHASRANSTTPRVTATKHVATDTKSSMANRPPSARWTAIPRAASSPQPTRVMPVKATRDDRAPTHRRRQDGAAPEHRPQIVVTHEARRHREAHGQRRHRDLHLRPEMYVLNACVRKQAHPGYLTNTVAAKCENQ
jgi:hypothetical protein